jgi:hypothetical protein
MCLWQPMPSFRHAGSSRAALREFTSPADKAAPAAPTNRSIDHRFIGTSRVLNNSGIQRVLVLPLAMDELRASAPRSNAMNGLIGGISVVHQFEGNETSNQAPREKSG